MTEPIDMNAYREEILRQFPELRVHWVLDDDDDESVSELMSYVVWWLRELGPSGITPEIETRVAAFVRWCGEQPAGETCDDDLFSMFMVNFFEALFWHETTRWLIPRIFEYEDIIQSADYLRQWVGYEAYSLALKEFPEHAGKQEPK